MYGSLTRAGMGRVLAAMAEHCGGLGPGDHLLDVGAGLGRPLLHALALGVGAASGVEVDGVKVEKAVAFVEQAARALAGRGGEAGRWLGGAPASPSTTTTTSPLALALAALPDIQCAPIEAMPSLDPASHAYAFWEGIPPAARAAFGRLVAASKTIRCVAVVQRAARGRGPAAMMADAGFGDLRLRAAFPVPMAGSGRSFQAYVFARDLPQAAAAGAVPVDCTAPLPRALAAEGSGAAAGPSSALAAPPTPSDSARSARRDRRRAGLPSVEADGAGGAAPGPRPITAFARVVRSAGGGVPPSTAAAAAPVARPGQVTPHHPGALETGVAARAAAPASPAATGPVGGGRRAPALAALARSPGVAKSGAASPAAKAAAAAARKAAGLGRPPLAPRGLGGALSAAVAN